jgi:beta-phosphoglucomutase-like phosphatase (HAD superfamily)
MIKAILFDLDGVLVQTEKLKALAYAKAIQRIRGLPRPDFSASEAYREVIGASRQARALT